MIQGSKFFPDFLEHILSIAILMMHHVQLYTGITHEICWSSHTSPQCACPKQHWPVLRPENATKVVTLQELIEAGTWHFRLRPAVFL